MIPSTRGHLAIPSTHRIGDVLSDIAGQGIANPIGAIESGALMLAHLGEQGPAERIRVAVAAAPSDGVWTSDLGGTATTAEVARSDRTVE